MSTNPCSPPPPVTNSVTCGLGPAGPAASSHPLSPPEYGGSGAAGGGGMILPSVPPPPSSSSPLSQQQSPSPYYSYSTNNNNYCQMSYSGVPGGGYAMSSLSPVTGEGGCRFPWNPSLYSGNG